MMILPRPTIWKGCVKQTRINFHSIPSRSSNLVRVISQSAGFSSAGDGVGSRQVTKRRLLSMNTTSAASTSGKLEEHCLFCKIVRGSIPCHKLYETDLSLAFLDIAPVSEGHTQVIPKYHAVTIADLPDEYLRDIMPIAKKVALSTGVKDFNILQNNGKLAFQHVDHVHFHVIPKPNEEEGMILSLEDNFKQKSPSQEELKITAERMRKAL